jgi:type I restriction enzyme M protein
MFNGSPLFTGQAGSGESEIRKWIIENDWLEAVIALPDQLFYNTGIATYIWIISNHKSAERKGKVQLINATGAKDAELLKEGKLSFNRFWQKMPRSLGNKRKVIAENGSEKGIGFIANLYGDFQENEFCKIYPNAFFGYWRVVVEQPLKNAKGKTAKNRQSKLKPDPKLRDHENIPFLRKDKRDKLIPQTIEEYFDREVRPHVPDAWIDESKTKTGYEINFTKYFYEFKPLRSVADIRADILKLEEETAELKRKVLA